MDSVSSVVTKTIPNYLSSLPVPKSLKGFSNLDCKFEIKFSNFLQKHFFFVINRNDII